MIQQQGRLNPSQQIVGTMVKAAGRSCSAVSSGCRQQLSFMVRTAVKFSCPLRISGPSLSKSLLNKIPDCFESNQYNSNSGQSAGNSSRCDEKVSVSTRRASVKHKQ